MSDEILSVVFAVGFVGISFMLGRCYEELKHIECCGTFTIIHWSGQTAWLSGSWLASVDR